MSEIKRIPCKVVFPDYPPQDIEMEYQGTALVSVTPVEFKAGDIPMDRVYITDAEGLALCWVDLWQNIKPGDSITFAPGTLEFGVY